jgi:hypothetical protein
MSLDLDELAYATLEISDQAVWRRPSIRDFNAWGIFEHIANFTFSSI